MNKPSLFPHAQKTPWLYFADGEKDETHTFYSVEENKFHLKNAVRQLDRREFFSYSHGWVITEDLDTKEIILVNPISMEQVIISPPPPLPEPEKHEKHEPDLCKSCNITAPPTDQDCLLFLSMAYCPFMKVYHLSEKKWNVWELDMKEETGLLHVLLLGESIFAFTPLGLLVRVIFDSCEPTIKYLDMEQPSHPFSGLSSNFSWIVSEGELYIVQLLMLTWKSSIEGLSVSKINLSEMRWEVVDDIGDRIFFLNFCNEGVSCSAFETRLTRNCIYYLSEDGYLYEYNLANRAIRMVHSFHHIGYEFWMLPKMDMHIGNDQSSERIILKDCEKIGQECYTDDALVTSTGLSSLETKEQMILLDKGKSKLEEKALTELHPDLVGLILHRLSYLDTRCIGNAIPSWLSVIRETPKPLDSWCIDTPCLLSFSNDFKICLLIDPFRNMRHIIRSPELQSRIKILSCKHGWLLLLATLESLVGSTKPITDLSIFFYNPLSKAIVELPPHKPIFPIRYYNYSFSSPPTSSNCVVVAENIFPNDRTIDICRKGDSKWTELLLDEDDKTICRNMFTTHVFLKGEFYILLRDGRIGIFDPAMEAWGVYGESKIINPKTHRHHLVESNDELYWISATKIGDSICVRKLDHSTYEWKEKESLEGQCFFVGQHSSVSVSASTFGSQEEIIYFPMTQDGRHVGYSCTQQKLFPKENFYCAEELLLGSCWIQPRWTQHTVEELQWF